MLAKGIRSIVWIKFGFEIVEQKQKGDIRSLCHFLKLIGIVEESSLFESTVGQVIPSLHCS